MKYIRTKNGRIYEVDVLSIHYLGETHFSCWDIKHTRAFNDWHIIKQADTIDELCDAIIYFEDDGNPETTNYFGVMTTFKVKIEFLKKMGSKDFNLGIYTDKGLIYVAKMNEKGELELI